MAWHTHQLKSEQYRNDTLSCLHRTPNHDDNVDAEALSAAYDATAKAWRLRFGVPYSVCGCIPDTEHDRKSRIGRLRTSFSRVGGKKNKLSLTPKFNTRPDLVTLEDREADSSHPSEHNIHFGNPNTQYAEIKKTSREKKAMECLASAKKSSPWDPWRALQAERKEKRVDKVHREAFTDLYCGYGYYYPYWGVSMDVSPG